MLTLLLTYYCLLRTEAEHAKVGFHFVGKVLTEKIHKAVNQTVVFWFFFFVDQAPRRSPLPVTQFNMDFLYSTENEKKTVIIKFY